MRPVNLMSPDDRGREASSNRTGALVYVVVGALVLILGGVTAYALTSKSISDRESEVAALEAEQAELEARAASLGSFVQFEEVKAAREETIASLARSRFDWERVMRELAAVLPNTVWLVSLSGSVAPEVTAGDGGGTSQGRDEIQGPALEMLGCARSQRDVARLVAALEDIDGVTRVLAAKSEKPTSAVSATSSGSSDDCRTRDFITRFEAVAAFDGVDVGPVAGSGEAADPDASGESEPPPSGSNELDAEPAEGEGGEPAPETVEEQADAASERADAAAAATAGGGAG